MRLDISESERFDIARALYLDIYARVFPVVVAQQLTVREAGHEAGDEKDWAYTAIEMTDAAVDMLLNRDDCKGFSDWITSQLGNSF